MEERREFLRIEDSGNLTYQKIFPPPIGIPKIATRENISGGGIKLITEEKLSEGDLLKLKIELSDSFGKTVVETTGEIIWIQEKEVGKIKKYEVGIAYRDISENERKKIISYVFRKQRYQRFKK
jgi:c-di-GMP-binding flagellar brake protein YcgR